MTIQTTLTRLHHANPAPNPETHHNAELFEQITALPGDTRPTPGDPRHAGTRRAVIVAFALATAALLVSTAYALNQWRGEAVKPKVTRSEYLHARHQLTL